MQSPEGASIGEELQRGVAKLEGGRPRLLPEREMDGRDTDDLGSGAQKHGGIGASAEDDVGAAFYFPTGGVELLCPNAMALRGAADFDTVDMIEHRGLAQL